MTVEELKNKLEELIKQGKGNYYITDSKGFSKIGLFTNDIHDSNKTVSI